MAGRTPGAGRKKGVPNKITVERERMLAASGLMPLDYMLAVLRDESEPVERRSWAANAAAPYCHPKLATIQHEGNGPEGQIQQLLRITFQKPPDADP